MVGPADPYRADIDRRAVRAPDFVGRQSDLSALVAAMSEPPAVVLVEGEAGVGKSRLVHEYLAAGSPGRALVAFCPPFREPFTLGPLVDALRQATVDVGSLHLTALAGVLRPLFPEWADELPAAPEPLDDARASRYRIFRAIAELLEALGVSVLVVEDAHWADEASLECLLFLTARHDRGLSLIVTHRPEDVPADSLLLRLLSRKLSGVSQQRLRLRPLERSDTGRMMSSMLGGEPVSDEFAGLVQERTEGLPLAVEETVRLMAERADLVRGHRGWVRRRLAEIEVPPTIRDAVLERTHRLGSGAQQVLDAVAVLAAPADEATIAAVAGLPADQVAEALVEAQALGLVHEHPPGLVAFRRLLPCRAVHDEIPPARRRHLHRAAADALERLAQPPVARLVRHLREAGDDDRWCQYAERLADLAMQSWDYATASTTLNDLLTRAEVPHAARARLAGKLARATALRTTRSDTHWQQVVRTLRAVIDGLRTEEQARIRSAIGRLLLQSGEYEAGRAELEHAIAGLDHDPAEAARTMTYLGWPVLASPWTADEHRRWLHRAAGTAASDQIDPPERRALAVDRAVGLLMLGDPEGWDVVAELPVRASPAYAREVVRDHSNLGHAATLWGRYQTARHHLSRALDVARQRGGDYWSVTADVQSALVWLDWLTGRWVDLAERAAALSDAEDLSPFTRLDATSVAALLDAARGAASAPGSAERLAAMIEDHSHLTTLDLIARSVAALAVVWLAAGRLEDALRVTAEPVHHMVTKRTWSWATEIAPVRVAALMASGAVEEARGVVTEFDRGMRAATMPGPLAALATCRALVTEPDDPARAAVLFERAADAWDALPRPYDALAARERQAGCLLASGAPERGVDLLTEVCGRLDALGATPDADRVARLLAEYGVRMRRSRPVGRPGYGDRLSPRELEVVRLVATGRTNREIARLLVISPKTVARHVDSAMRKSGAPSRTALAVAAVEGRIAGADGSGAGHQDGPDTAPAAQRSEPSTRFHG